MLKLGSSKPWKEAMKAITGKGEGNLRGYFQCGPIVTKINQIAVP